MKMPRNFHAFLTRVALEKREREPPRSRSPPFMRKQSIYGADPHSRGQPGLYTLIGASEDCGRIRKRGRRTRA
jgi:hypothetical protein